MPINDNDIITAYTRAQRKEPHKVKEFYWWLRQKFGGTDKLIKYLAGNEFNRSYENHYKKVEDGES